MLKSLVSSSIAYTDLSGFEEFKEMFKIDFKLKYNADADLEIPSYEEYKKEQIDYVIETGKEIKTEDEYKKEYEQVKIDYPKYIEEARAEIYTQYLAFVNSPYRETDEPGIFQVDYMDTVVTMKAEYKKGKSLIPQEIFLVENEEDFYFEMNKREREELNLSRRSEYIDTEDIFVNNLTKSQVDMLIFATENKVIKVTSPTETGKPGPQIIAFQNKNSDSDITITFRGTEGGEDWKQNIQMWTASNEPAYFQQAREFVDELLFDKNGEIKAEYKNLNVNFNGHSLGGSLAQYINQYISTKIEKKAKEHIENESSEAIKYKNIDMTCITFNAATSVIGLMNPQQDYNKIAINKTAINYELTSNEGEKEILSYLGSNEPIPLPFENRKITSFRKNFSMYDAHFLDELYNSVLIYDFINELQIIRNPELSDIKANKKTTESDRTLNQRKREREIARKNVDYLNQKIEEIGMDKFLKSITIMWVNNLKSLDELASLDKEELEELNDDTYIVELEEVMHTLFGEYIKEKKNDIFSQISTDTANKLIKMALRVLPRNQKRSTNKPKGRIIGR